MFAFSFIAEAKFRTEALATAFLATQSMSGNRMTAIVTQQLNTKITLVAS